MNGSKPKKIYLLSLFFLAIGMIVLLENKQYIAILIGFWGLLTFGFFMLRNVLGLLKLTHYLKTHHLDLYEKHSFSLASTQFFTFIKGFATDKKVRQSPDVKLRFLREELVSTGRYLLYAFVLFVVLLLLMMVKI